jgi:hypothetical protein
MAKIPMVAPLIVKVFLAIKLNLPQFGFTSHIIDFEIRCQQHRRLDRQVYNPRRRIKEKYNTILELVGAKKQRP